MNTTSSKPSFQRRGIIRFLALSVLAGIGCLGVAQAQTYPSKPVTLVIPYPAGGANDILGRLIGQKMSEGLGQQIIIDNRPGAGTLIGAGYVAKATPDGYTILVGGFAPHAVAPHLMKADYDPVKDFEPIGMIGSAATVALTYPNAPYKNLKDLVDAAKIKPGVLMYGSAGNGTPPHISGETFTAMAGINMIHVPYKGGSAHTMDLMGGRLDVIFDATTSGIPLVKGGKVRAIAVSTATRLPDYPDVQTFAEAGFPQFAVNPWYALYAPAKTPKEIVGRLSAELQKVLKMPEVVAKLSGSNVMPGTGTSEELAKFGPAEFEKYGKIIKAANIKAD